MRGRGIESQVAGELGQMLAEAVLEPSAAGVLRDVKPSIVPDPTLLSAGTPAMTSGVPTWLAFVRLTERRRSRSICPRPGWGCRRPCAAICGDACPGGRCRQSPKIA